MKVSRSYTFPMGHRLMRHHGRCRWPHGHNWTAVVEVESRDGEPSVWQDDRSDCGMVMDFVDLDAVVKPIIDGWDHGFMVEDRDPFRRHLQAFADEDQNAADARSGARILVVPFAPTSENIAGELWRLVDEALGRRGERCLSRVAVSESDRSWAEITKESL